LGKNRRKNTDLIPTLLQRRRARTPREKSKKLVTERKKIFSIATVHANTMGRQTFSGIESFYRKVPKVLSLVGTFQRRRTRSVKTKPPDKRSFV